MDKIALPQKPEYVKGDDWKATFEIKGCYPGYGSTLGNALRRVLLSSLPGYAVTQVKFAGVDHEFATIPNVLENVIQIILNIKNIRFIMHKDEPIKIKLKVTGEKEVKAKSIKVPSSIEIVNPDAKIATLTDPKAKLEIEMIVEKGIGYSSTEERGEGSSKEIGLISIDALFTPIRKINYTVENMRVGKRTDFDKLTFEIETDGSIKPEDAFKKASQILIKQFAVLACADEAKIVAETEEELSVKKEKAEKKEVLAEKKQAEELKSREAVDVQIEDLNLPTRITRMLKENGIETLKDLSSKTEEELNSLEGVGLKGIKEIKKAVGSHGIILAG